MQTRVYKLYAASLTTANAAASLTIQQNGFISAICWHSVGQAAAADDTQLALELSLVPQQQAATNDTAGVLAMTLVGESTALVWAENMCLSNMAIPVRAGDRLNINAVLLTGTAAQTHSVECFIYVATK